MSTFKEIYKITSAVQRLKNKTRLLNRASLFIVASELLVGIAGSDVNAVDL